MFNLEQSIQNWKRSLRSNPAFEEGDIEELESHLRDEIEKLKAKDFNEEEAFNKAIREIGEPQSIGDELYKTRAVDPYSTPSWKQSSWIPSLLPSYFKVSFRNLVRRKSYAFLNIAGLAVGIATCLLILFYVKSELSYDRFHDNSDRIYRIVSEWEDFSIPTTSISVVNRLEDDFPQIESLAWVMKTDGLVTHEDRSFIENNLYMVPPSYLQLFKFPMLHGDLQTALERPFTVVLTSKTAQKYFGDENPIGQSIEVDNQYEVEVTGVLKEIPDNTHFNFGFLVSWQTMEAAFDYSNAVDGQWGNNSIYTYMLLSEGSSPENLESEFPAFARRHAGDDWNTSTLLLQPLTDIHLYSHHNDELSTNSQASYVYIFSIIAIAILVIACINFINLATARSSERAREVGVRKSLGANRGQLVRQFISESLVLAFAAMLLSLLLVAAAEPAFEVLSGKELTMSQLYDGFTVSTLMGITIFIGLLAGSFPAFVLSGFQPVSVLRGVLPVSKSGDWLRKGLVVFQFSVSIILIVGTIIVYNQLDYLRSASLGFDQEQVLVIPMQGGDDIHMPKFETFKQELTDYPGVEYVSTASVGLPSELLDGTSVGFVESNVHDDSLKGIRLVSVSHDFFKVMGVDMIAGRDYSEDFSTDSGAYVLNEAAFRFLANELPEPITDPAEGIGKELRGWHDFPPTGKLVGVTENFNMATLHESVEPVLFMIRPSWFDHYLIRINAENIGGTVASVQDTWNRFYSEWPLEYNFADQAFDARYRAEEKLGQIFAAFAGLAIFVACLGLFGLAAFTAEKRTREIGIRKVLGASVSQIVLLLSKDFMKLVLAAFLIALPVGWYAMNQWLQDFAYHIQIGYWIFLAAGILALIITLITVSGQSVKAALQNPVNSLKSE